MKKKAVFILLFALSMFLAACGGKEIPVLDKFPQTTDGIRDLSEEESSLAEEGADIMAEYDFSIFTNVELIGWAGHTGLKSGTEAGYPSMIRTIKGRFSGGNIHLL